ncbi:hypothetical protein [Polynucleobacter antarcticus]|uniref:Rod shape-determining protein MreD n=1 Tax=Polynucleobacter antarcticus TaxID=1743162 RepID=A0A6M9PPI5_9BURK|nr:hypothetical protein [Polynucleobacter antarcticus]QKM62429.1 hypothetical protein DCO16_04750 [Polynucleobacter antarcticus]
MINSLKKLIIVGVIALIWISLDAINQGYFGFLKITELEYFVYWLSGLRLVAIILFGWLGFWGIFIGYFTGEILSGDTIIDAAALGILSSLAPMIAYRYWQSATSKNDDFDHVDFTQLCYLVFLHSLLTALFRNFYFYFVNQVYGIDQLTMSFSANVLGSFAFLYLLMFFNRFYKKLRPKSIH